ncbi:hypothetical protein B0H11DRAFT_2237131 [Mycena galericulata]|nr:hypothetical protein B0H11DRAFT_2237131 [Mycena galericulata]
MDPSTRDLVFQAIRDLEFVPPPIEIEMLTLPGLAGVTLKTAGLRIQLGHPLYAVCPTPIPDNNFVILDADGLHEVALDYCGCTNPVLSRGKQLRDARFFPDNDLTPRTAVAFKLAYGSAVPTSMRVHRRRLEMYSTWPFTWGFGAKPPGNMRRVSLSLMQDLDPAQPCSPSPDDSDQELYLKKPKAKVKLRPFVPVYPVDEDDPVSQPYVSRYFSADDIERKVYSEWFLAEETQGTQWQDRWNADFDAAFEAYQESESASVKEGAADVFDESMLLDLTDNDDDAHEIRQPGVIYLENLHPAGSAEALRYETEFNRLSDECWHHTGMLPGRRHERLDDEESRTWAPAHRALDTIQPRSEAHQLLKTAAIDLEEID